MKILLYGINFSPELVGIGKYTGELAAWLAARGHEVSVIAAPPYYPDWKVREGHSSLAYRYETWEGVDVYRVPVWVPRQPSGLKRILHLASFALASLPIAWWRLAHRPDLILVIEPPLFCAPAALLGAALAGTRTWLHIQDFEVDAAFELGLLKGKRLRGWIQRCERLLLRRFSRVSTISSKMLQLARAKGVEQERLELVPNWIDLDAIKPRHEGRQLRAELGVPPDAVVALYSGNMGGKQGLEILGDVATLLAAHSSVHFVFCGEGSHRARLEERCHGLANVRFLPLQSMDRFAELLACADIHLLPQRKDAADLVMPSKLAGMLASGRPLICAAPSGSELANVVSLCGVLTPPEDARAMASSVLRLAHDPVLRARLGQAGRAYAVSRLASEPVLLRFEQAMLRCLPIATSSTRRP